MTDRASNDKRHTECMLFVGNLPFQTPWQAVKDRFREAGDVRYTDLIADRQGRPKGCALVTMADPAGATKAIEMFNETEFEGRRLIVRHFDDGPRPPLVQRQHMPPFGGPRGAKTDSPPANGGRSRRGGGGTGAGSAKTSNAPPAGSSKDGVPKPRSMQPVDNERKLFVSNLPFDCSSSALIQTFEQIGVVEKAEIIVGRNGKSRGMGIVVMGSADDARIAIEEFDGIEMANRAMHVRLDQKS